MKIILFDSILERHLVESLERALIYLGCEVLNTNLLVHSHEMIKKNADKKIIWDALEKAIEFKADLLIAFRPMNLTNEMLIYLRKHMKIAVWLSDDPVLYKVCYEKIAKNYDILLHCGSEKIIEFYHNKGFTHGVNFPFWTDHHAFPNIYNPEKSEVDVVFLGNMHGQVRRKRYLEFASLPYSKKVYGLLDSDPCGIHGGFIHEAYHHCDLVSNILSKAKVGLSIPQFFKEYKGLHYDFKELSSLGYFQIPSRVIQYVASGLPCISIGENDMKNIFPELEIKSSLLELKPYINNITSSLEYAKEQSNLVLERFRCNYSSLARANFLLEIIKNEQYFYNISILDKVNIFLEYTVQYDEKTY